MKTWSKFLGLKHTGLAIVSLILAIPFSGQGAGVVSTPTLAAFNSALSGGGAVTFACDGTINITSTETISANTTIDATGHNIVISGGTSNQIFQVNSGVNLALTTLIISGGYTRTNGGAIYNLGNVAATNCAFIGNYAIGIPGSDGSGAGSSGQAGSIVRGGTIYNLGALTLATCKFEQNFSVGGAGGNAQTGANVGTGVGGNGGVGGGGGAAFGGAIFSSNSIVAFDCTFDGNGVEGGNGGAGGTAGSGPSGYGNAGAAGQGGDGDGGAIYTYKASTIVRSTFSNQLGIGGNSGAGGNGLNTAPNGVVGGNAYGGGIFNGGTNISLNCTFYYAQVQSGAGGASGAAYTGPNGGNGGVAEGGGIYSILRAGITNCTFSTNVLYGGAGGAAFYYTGGTPGTAGSTGVATGGAVGNNGGTFTLKNSILAYSSDTGGSGSSGNGAGTITDAGNNISSDTSITLGGSGSHSNTDPKLAPLASNGGYTSTCALNSGSPAINAGADGSAPPTDQRGYVRAGTSDIGSYEYNGVEIIVRSLGKNASLDGNVGLFLIGSLNQMITNPIVVNFTITGTASNGLDYVYITNTVTIPAGALNARVLVNGIPGAFAGTNKAVTMTPVSGTNYLVTTHYADPSQNSVYIYDHNNYDSTKRYVRGTSTAPDFQSFVVPLGLETGVALDSSGGNASTFFPGNLWTNTLYHFNATNLLTQTNTTGRIPFQNPLVAFGDPVGGSSLFLNQTYGFGIAVGSAANLTNALRIQVYYRTNSALAGTITMTLPDVTNTNQLLNLVTNGFTQTFSGFGLQTTLVIESSPDWGVLYGQNYVLNHTASSAATNYYYEIEEKGTSFGNSMVLNSTNGADWSRLYVTEFSPYPNGLSTFINEPHFDGIPMPSLYLGKSLTELQAVQATLPNLSSLVPSNYLTLDASPELRRHPILDQFVKNMGNDPMGLANYVVNEVGLVDGIDLNTNYSSQTTINLGGVDRSALDTFLEGQGSPMEQCSLLVYLLRQAGVPATYVFPTNGGLQMLSSQMSKLLQVQLVGAVNYLGQTNVSTLLNVNYPWVAAYVGTNWVQIFPWMKDTEITEGFNLYDYMPTNYNSGYKWMTHFIASDTNIFSLSSSDQPSDLLPLFIQKNLNQNYPGMSVSDLGMQVVNRRHQYSQWSDFPLPFALSGAPMIVESLKTNLNLFNTIEVQVYSQANSTNLIDTGEMYEADLQNRALLLKFQQVGSANVHNMILSLEPYSTGYTNVAAFSTNANPCWKLATTNQLVSTDDSIVYQITHRRSKFLPSGYLPSVAPTINPFDYFYFEQGQQSGGLTAVQTDYFRKGDLVAFCFNSGRVSQDMLNVHAQEIWKYNQTANTNNPATNDPDLYLGQTTYLLGMSYYNYIDQFRSFVSKLHKITVSTWHEEGYALIRPKRDNTGALVNGGNVVPITPAVHMPNNGGSTIFDGSVMANSGRDFFTTTLDWWLQYGVESSAAEHGVLKSYYQTNALSTVKLLQQVGTNAVILTAASYQTFGQKTYNGTALMNADPVVWGTISGFFATNNDTDSEVIMTPGAITNGTYIGVGALLINDNTFAALVGGFNGGYSWNFPDATFGYGNSPYLDVDYSDYDSVTPYYMDTTPEYSAGYGDTINGAVTSWDLLQASSAISSGAVQLDPVLQSVYSGLQEEFGVGQDAGSAYNQLYNYGTVSTQPSTYNDGSQRVSDPVNMMTGEFYVDAPDISLPGPMPLQIRRNYGSQNLAENEFGFGWRMSDTPFLSVATNSTLIYANEMDGTTVAYRQTTTNANVWLPQPQDNPTLNNNSSIGIGSVGNLFNNRLQMAIVGGTNTYTLTGADGSTRSFTQRSYPISTFTRQRPYLDKWQDSRGNFYTFQFGTDTNQPDYGEVNRIQSSNGNFVGFYYDVYGHIIKAYTGDGRWLYYTYDQFGDLTSVVLPDQMEIDYLYQHATSTTNGVYSTHLIIEEDKPDGRVLQNVYDSQRRVTNQLSTVGTSLTPVRSATFLYTNNYSLTTPTNLLTGVTVISDALNHSTTYFYTNSLVRKIIDPMNQAITQDWYETNSAGGFQRSLKSQIDKRGVQQTFYYDVTGNLTNSIVTGDLTGSGLSSETATNSAIYNTNNLPTKITDPTGNSTVIVYDSVFNFLPQQTIRYAGATSVSTNLTIYGNATNVVVDGSVLQTNIAFGLATRQIRAFGSTDAATNDSLYNGQGFPISTIQYTGTGDPNVVNQLLYDERDELIQRTDAAGAIHVYDYDPMGRKIAEETYDAGQSNPMDFHYFYYNANGELNWIDGPRYNPEDYTFFDYDGAGRTTTEIHWRSEAKADGSGVQAPSGYNLYAQTFSQYDALGNMVSKVDPRGAVTTNSFDAICRLTQTSRLDTNGVTVLSTESFGYEPGGLIHFRTNALGGVTTTLYTSLGKPEFQSNPDGSTNGWTYYLDGRIKREIQSNGSYWQSTYDDANRITTRIFYSAAGSPEATNSVQVDRRGNAVLRVDAGGNTFTTTFDGLDRPKANSGPAILTVSEGGSMPNSGIYVTNVLQQTFTNYYDIAGRAITNVNVLGEKTVSLSDAIGRPTSVLVFNSSGTLARETYISYSADHNSMTTTNGSGANAIVNTTYTDSDGHDILSIAYPSSGSTEFKLSQYDLAGNLVSTKHNSSVSGVVTNWTSATLTYDGLGRLIAKTDRDGAQTTYAYDAINDLTNRLMPGNVQWQGTFNIAGRMLSERNINGTAGTRTNVYTYYAAGSPFAGLLQTKTDGRGVTCTYNYDDRLRITTNAYTGALPEQNLTTVWQYDARNLVKSITEQFASTNTGPATTILRSYDPYSQLGSESVSGGSYGFGASQSWDAAGRRSLLSMSGGSYGFGWQADGNLTSASDPTGSGVYTYNTAGLLTSRTVGNRYTAINSRDGEGRPTSISTTVNMASALTESMSWSGDGLLSNHTLARTDFTDNHAYSYAPLSRRLVQEQLNLNAGTSWTNAMTYDNGVPAGPGVLTQIGQATGSGGQWSSSADAFSRVAIETNNSIQFAAYGHVNGQSLLDAWLDNQPVSITGVGTNAMQWRATMELTPGAHQLKVAANHPSGFYTAWATNSFTNSIAYQAATDTYDPAGNITNRVWKSASGTVDRTQTLSWDARGRLHSVVERDSSNSGYNWTAVYDALNRRIQTTSVLVSNGVASTASPQSINQYYDPQVEFLELGLSSGIQTVWKLYGPDLNGRYGGLNGTGGFDGFSPYLNQFAPVISDFRGNILAEITNGVVSWSPSRPTGYGAVPGYRPAPFGNGVDISLASAWRGRWEDITGYYHVGMRDYDSVSGRWLTYDSVWNELDPNGYSFAGGEPIMGFDADGRLYFDVGTFFSGFGHDLYSTGSRFVNGVVQAGAIGSDMIGSSFAGGVDSAFGTDYQANYQGYSQLYQNIAAHPSSGPTAGSILLGTANTELNVVTFGGASVVEGGYTAYQTGNYNQLQDSFAGIAIAGGTAYGLNKLNPVTYRGVGATDNPSSAFTDGFSPRGNNDDLWEHVNDSSDSAYVSTSRSYTIASDTYAGWAYGDGNPVYEVQGSGGVNTYETLKSQGYNVDDPTKPWIAADQETAFKNGVSGNQITGYYNSDGSFVSNPSFGLNGNYAGAVGSAYLAGSLGTKK